MQMEGTEVLTENEEIADAQEEAVGGEEYDEEGQPREGAVAGLDDLEADMAAIDAMSQDQLSQQEQPQMD